MLMLGVGVVVEWRTEEKDLGGRPSKDKDPEAMVLKDTLEWAPELAQ